MGERVQMNSTIVEQATEFSFVCKWRVSGGVFERDFLFSPFFSIGEGLNGRLGIKRTNSSGLFSLYFQLRKPKPEPTDFDQLVYFKFSLINQLDGSESIRKDFSYRFSKKEGVCCVSDFAKTELLLNPHLGFVLENENCLTVEINLVNENSGYYYHKTRTRLHTRSDEDDGYDTVYLWEIQYFQSLREMAEKSEILHVQSRTFQTVQRDFHIVVYPRGKVNETHLGVFLKPEEPSCDQIHFSFVTLCIVNKNDFSMSVTRNYPNPIRKIGSDEFGSDEFISFKDLLDSSQGYVDNGSIKFVIKVLTLKETISKDREELNNVYRLDLSGEFVIWRVDNFSAFIDFLVGGLILESQPFEVHGCEHQMVISVNGSICASLKCEKDQKDFVYKVGVWNREEIVFAISTFYNPSICLKKLADVSSEDRSMTFILHIPDHSDPGIFEGICQLDPRSELWKPYATVCSDYPNILKGLLDSAVHTKNSDKAATHFSTLTSLVKETQDLTVPTLDMMWKEILTGGHRIIDRDSRIQHIQTLLVEAQSNAEVAKEKFDEKLKSFASIIENLKGDRLSLTEEIKQFNREVLQLGKKAEKDERELEMSRKLLDESQTVLAETQRTAELAKIRFGEELTRYARGMENLNGDRQSLLEQIGQLKVEIWQLVGEKAEKDGRITHLEIENSMVKENLIFCQDKLMEERSISARFHGFGLDLLSEVEIDKVLRFHAEKLEQTYEVIKRRRLGNQR